MAARLGTPQTPALHLPGVKTLRRKLNSLATGEAAVVALGRAMAKRHVERSRKAVAFLYVDGHVRPYFGETTLGKATLNPRLEPMRI